MNYVTVQICFITFCNHKNRNLKKATREQSKSNSEYIHIFYRIGYFIQKNYPLKLQLLTTLFRCILKNLGGTSQSYLAL